MTRPDLTFAVSHYDRFVPFLDGSVRPDGFDVTMLHVGQSVPGRHGTARHEQMLQKGAFDVCEVSLSSYLMARARKRPFTAIPAFPRRLFSQSQMWINAKGRVRTPEDLAGKRVGVGTFQTTLSVLARGDLQSEYGVPWRRIEWIAARTENVAFEPAPGVSLRLKPEGSDLGAMLQAGEIDAIFNPQPPRPALAGDPDIRRLFDDPRAEEARYFHKNGFYPIMHVIVFRDDVLERHPGAAEAFLAAFTEADAVSRRYYDDPNWSRLAWGRLDIEDERRLLGADLWPIGVAKNRSNLERFIGYSHDQGLIDSALPVDSLFVEATLTT